jgi:TRAP-type C4-dicarboxylate transport system permease small subunit
LRTVLHRIDSALALLENSLIILTLGLMVILAFLQVLLRNFFETGLLWGDIFLRHLVLWVGFAGASLATRQEKHINIDILTRVIPARLIPQVKIVIDIIAAVICFVLARASYIFLTFEIEAGTTLFEDIPSWYFQIILPLGFAMMGFRYFLKIVEQISVLVKKEKE